VDEYSRYLTYRAKPVPEDDIARRQHEEERKLYPNHALRQDYYMNELIVNILVTGFFSKGSESDMFVYPDLLSEKEGVPLPLVAFIATMVRNFYFHLS
jgi:hypothetical protein